MVLGLVLSSAIFLGGMAWAVMLRQSYRGTGWHLPARFGGFLGLVFLVPAAIPGVITGWLVHRMPKTLVLRCRQCQWRQRYRVGADGHVIDRLGFPVMPVASASERVEEDRPVDANDTAPPGPPAAPTPGFEVVMDDVAGEVGAWVYREIAEGRSPEEVAGDLVAAGWARKEAEALAERGRRETRHLRR
jgi:hypothetical protein